MDNINKLTIGAMQVHEEEIGIYIVGRMGRGYSFSNKLTRLYKQYEI